MFPSPSVQSPRAYDLNNLGAAALGARLEAGANAALRANIRATLQDSGYRYRITPLETAAGFVDADLIFGFDPGDVRRYALETADADDFGYNTQDDSPAFQAASCRPR